MQRPTHASIGASSLGPTPPAQAWGDAFRSIELVGSSTHERESTVEPVGLDEPIEAARAWLAEPDRRDRLGKTIIACAEESLVIASDHLRELDLLAGQVAREANDSGAIDPLRLERVDLMASVMRAYAKRMRSLLDPAAGDIADTERRLRAGLQAARAGGLPALVSTLDDVST